MSQPQNPAEITNSTNSQNSDEITLQLIKEDLQKSSHAYDEGTIKFINSLELILERWEQYPKEYEFQQQLFNQCERHLQLENKYVEKEDAETANIFKSFGCYYFDKVAQDKLSSGNIPGYRLSILRSVGLLCAAKVRESDDGKKAKIDNIIAAIWSSVICQASCSNDTDDERRILFDAVKSTKSKLMKMRDKTNKVLDEVKNDPKRHSIIQLQKSNTEEFKEIIISIYQNCMSLIGSPPCEFDLMGLGSLARGEFTPYSDFESSILLETPTEETTEEEQDSWKDYFRSVSLLFGIVMLNLEETLVPALNIPALNNKLFDNDWFFDIRTPSGIAFDGLIPSSCINPLGRMEPTLKKKHLTEFIKPIDEMLKFLDDDEVLLNGYHVREVLMCSTSISNENFGKRQIFEEFQQKLCSKLQKRKQEFRDKALQLFQQSNVIHILQISHRSVFHLSYFQ